MATSQQLRAAQNQNWNNYQSQVGNTSQADWNADLQNIRAQYASDPQGQARALASKYLANTNAAQYLSPQMRDWIKQRAPMAYMQSTMDTLTGNAGVDATKLQGGMDFGQFTNWLNKAQAGTGDYGINGYSPSTANNKWATFQQRMGDAFNPASTMDAGVRGIWQNMDEQDLLDYQRMLMQQTLSPMLYKAADAYLQDQWTNNELSTHPLPYNKWVPQASGNPMFNSRWRW